MPWSSLSRGPPDPRVAGRPSRRALADERKTGRSVRFFNYTPYDFMGSMAERRITQEKVGRQNVLSGGAKQREEASE